VEFFYCRCGDSFPSSLYIVVHKATFLPIIMIRCYYYHKQYEHNVFRVTNASFVYESPPEGLGIIRFTFTLDMTPP
jgi:hypothetical protein